jgi:hypothetical protein
MGLKRLAALAVVFFGVLNLATPAVAGTWFGWIADKWDDTITLAEFLAQVMRTSETIGGLPTLLKVSAVITLLVSSLKVTALRGLIWERLGAGQVLVAPALGLIAGLVGLGTAGPVTLPVVLTYVMAGGGAVFLHELLDAMKALPGLGVAYIRAIEAIQRALGGGESVVGKARQKA